MEGKVNPEENTSPVCLFSRAFPDNISCYRSFVGTISALLLVKEKDRTLCLWCYEFNRQLINLYENTIIQQHLHAGTWAQIRGSFVDSLLLSL